MVVKATLIDGGDGVEAVFKGIPWSVALTGGEFCSSTGQRGDMCDTSRWGFDSASRCIKALDSLTGRDVHESFPSCCLLVAHGILVEGIVMPGISGRCPAVT